MLRLHQLYLPLNAGQRPNEDILTNAVAKRLHIANQDIKQVTLIKRSLDAREKPKLRWCFTVDVLLKSSNLANKIAKKHKPNELTLIAHAQSDKSLFDMQLEPWIAGKHRPIVVGAGPAGLFCALVLALRGANPILIERGKAVEQRTIDVNQFMANSQFIEESHVLFGEGGAGAFSDGKLTCGINNPNIQTILNTFVALGAPEDILLQKKPHIGTDILVEVLKNLRQKLIDLGTEIQFSTCLIGIETRNQQVEAIRIRNADGESIQPTNHLFLAIGHSARDTYTWLHNMGIPMSQKPFAVGVRIEHLQTSINESQYGKQSIPLPACEYKLNVHTPDKRGVYTFCMCPGGSVIPAISEPDGINVNGMSLHARNNTNANSAVLVGVRPADFGSEHPLAGVNFQREMEQRAFNLTKSYLAPCQRVGDFLSRNITTGFGEVVPSYRPGVSFQKLDDVLPDFICENLRFALPLMDKKLRGFSNPDAILTGPETRSSSPLRILRNENRESTLRGLFPLGEGAGYAGGIMSAALDGMLAGEGCQSAE